MKKEHSDSGKPDLLRQKGEEQLNEKQPVKSVPLDEADTSKLIHELKARQIELETQNEELRLAVNNAAIDITEHNKAEIILKEKVKALSRLATVVNDSNDAIILHDLEGKILVWNRGAKETYGYSEVEALGMNIKDIVALNDREAALTLIQKIKQGEIVKSFELRRVTKDGRVLDVWITATVLTDDKGEPVAIATTERDITDRKLKEEELIAAKAKAEEMIGLMGKSIGVQAERNKGPQFYFTVPAKQTNQIRTGTPSPQTVQDNLLDWTILVADDEPINFLLIKILLSGIVKRIDHAFNGKEVVDLVSQNRYNLILMALKMPVMGGIEATKILKQKFPELPIIAQTAYTFPEEKETALRAGCDDFISKPIKKGDLMTIINKYI